MGTNYYYYEKLECECCHRPYEAIHIGKRSSGWAFALHVIPGEIEGIEDWIAMFYRAGSSIVDEYGRSIVPYGMIKIICGGYDNPRRRDIRAGDCIGHGSGPWDLLVGEFS